MTPEAQNRAIHEFIGGNKFVGLKKRGLWYRPDAKGYTSDENQAGRYTQEEAKGHEYVRGDADEWVRICHFKVPNYTGSLDAMSQAEEYFNVPWSKWPSDKPYVGWDEYWQKLVDVTGCRCFDSDTSGDCKDMLHATSAQRAEAFLKTVGRWQEKGEK